MYKKVNALLLHSAGLGKAGSTQVHRDRGAGVGLAGRVTPGRDVGAESSTDQGREPRGWAQGACRAATGRGKAKAESLEGLSRDRGAVWSEHRRTGKMGEASAQGRSRDAVQECGLPLQLSVR